MTAAYFKFLYKRQKDHLQIHEIVYTGVTMAGSGGGEVPRVDPNTKNNTFKSWATIASMNTSNRKETNTLEVRLENDERKGTTLNNEEIERLLKRLNILTSQFTCVQACPERRNVVYITLGPGVDINKFINKNTNESYFVKPGVRTTTIKHANKKEVPVQVFGLHPDTKDEAVIKYLNAHGQVDTKHPVVYGVYEGGQGSILAGKRNGNRTYSVLVKRNIGSSHVIDGVKVSIRYPGQIKTCNNCQQEATSCPGKGIARDCSSEHVSFSDFMLSYWKKIDFQPDTRDMNFEDEENEEDSVIVKVDQVRHSHQKLSLESEMAGRYGGVAIKGFRKETELSEIVNVLKEAGLPFDYEKEDLETEDSRGEFTTIKIRDLKPVDCVEIVNNLNGEVKFGKKISVFALVDDSPTKQSGEDLDNLINSETDEKVDNEESSKQTPETISKGYKVHDKKSPSSNSSLFGNLVKMWNGNEDLHISEDSDEDLAKDTDDSILKRKYFEKSPENNEFQRSRKRKNKKLRNKSS